METINNDVLIESMIMNIKNEPDAKKALDSFADLYMITQKQDTQNQEKILVMLGSVRKDIRGNGTTADVKCSLLYRLSVLESQVKWIIDVSGIIGVSIGGWLISSILGLI